MRNLFRRNASQRPADADFMGGFAIQEWRAKKARHRDWNLYVRPMRDPGYTGPSGWHYCPRKGAV